MRTAKALSLITIVATLVIGVSLAQEQKAPPSRLEGRPPMREPAGGAEGQRFGGGGREPVRMVLSMREQLNITEEQVKKLESLKSEDPNAVQKANQELMDARRALNASVIASETEKIKELSQKIGAATEKVSLLQAQDYKKIKGILTPEQFQNLQQIITNPPRRTPGPMGTQGQEREQGNRPAQQ
jgi:Spy/CpxP family protein refolding chaperone